MTDAPTRRFTYPDAPRGDTVEDYHGTTVADPYRWLEDPDSDATRAWGQAQADYTEAYLAEIPQREAVRDRLRTLWDYPRANPPTKRGDLYLSFLNDGLQNQPVLYKQHGLDGEREVLLDPNTLSDDGTVAVTYFQPSDDGRLLAYMTASGGSDWEAIRVRDIATGQDYDEVIDWCKFTNVAWKADGSGFYYGRFPEVADKMSGEPNYFNKVYWHTVGTPQSDDVLIYERPDEKKLRFNPIITDDNAYLVLFVPHAAINRNRLYYRPLDSDDDFTRLIDEPDAAYDFFGNDGAIFYVRTDLDAPRGRIVAIDIDHPERDNWRELVAESQDTLSNVTMVADHFVITYLHNAHSRLALHALDGTHVRDVPLPTLGTVAFVQGERDHDELFFQFTSYLYPPTVLRYDFTTGQTSEIHRPQIAFAPEGYETTQVSYPSKDGTPVTMFLTHKRGLALDGTNPTLLYGYGGYNISLTPSYGTPFLQWLEAGGVYAVANLRGGGEYGEAWHRAGMLEQKQNTFDDMIAAGEWLIEQGYTRSDRLAIMGGSNGGLLVAACMLQRPELFGAVICQVPVTDMLRFHRFTAGRFWTDEYGNAEDDPDHFRFLYTYSPVHNVQDGTTYPPTLVITADMDDRVVPMHAKKFTAALQAADSGQNPILLRLDIRAGHGMGKPVSKLVDQWTDTFAFLYHVMGITDIGL